MAEFRTSSGVVTTTPIMRTASGLVECAPQFRTALGLVDCGSGKPLTAQADPDFVSGAQSGTTRRIYTNSTTVTPQGGKAPYSYSWAGPADWQIASPSAASTNFSSIVSPGGDKSETFVCTITDAKGAMVQVNVFASVANYGGGGNVNLQ